MFLFSLPSVKADKIGQSRPNPGDNQKYAGLSYYVPSLNANKSMKYYVLYVVTSGGTTYHIYCVEQGIHLGEGYDASGIPSESYTYNNLSVDQKGKIFQIMSVGYNVGTKSSEQEFVNAAHNSDLDKLAATQELIWEVVRGERSGVTGFNNYRPTTGARFYNVVSNNSFTANLFNEYKALVDKVKYTFYKAPNGFSLGAASTTHSMDFINGKFTLTLNTEKGAYKNFNVSVPSGINYSISGDGSTITFTSDKAFSGVKEVKITNKNNSSSGMVFYHDGEKQDVARGGTSVTYYLKLSTPKYQIKINKKAKLDGAPLEGAKFNICANSSCTSILGTITTDENGVATFDDIDKPGTYYVKETKAPPGYELDKTPHAVTVTTSNVAGSASYGTANITDANKEFNLTKKSVDENGVVTDIDDGCGTDTYTGPEFEIRDSRGNSLYFTELKSGEYNLANKDTEGAVTKLKTCNGKMKVYTLTECNYTVVETKAPEGLTLPSNPSQTVNVCGAGKNVSFTNGFAGLEFQKKDEDGNFVAGGKFALQRKENNVYVDVLLKENEPGSYVYDANLKETDEGATYILLTNGGIARISKLPPGEYRIVEKEAPEGYELIKDKDSKALVTIKDSDKDGYYLVEMIDQKVNKNGSESFAELIITIITGRRNPNYLLIIPGLAILLVLAIIIRKKIKK